MLKDNQVIVLYRNRDNKILKTYHNIPLVQIYLERNHGIDTKDIVNQDISLSDKLDLINKNLWAMTFKVVDDKQLKLDYNLYYNLEYITSNGLFDTDKLEKQLLDDKDYIVHFIKSNYYNYLVTYHVEESNLQDTRLLLEINDKMSLKTFKRILSNLKLKDCNYQGLSESILKDKIINKDLLQEYIKLTDNHMIHPNIKDFKKYMNITIKNNQEVLKMIRLEDVKIEIDYTDLKINEYQMDLIESEIRYILTIVDNKDLPAIREAVNNTLDSMGKSDMLPWDIIDNISISVDRVKSNDDKIKNHILQHYNIKDLKRNIKAVTIPDHPDYNTTLKAAKYLVGSGEILVSNYDMGKFLNSLDLPSMDYKQDIYNSYIDVVIPLIVELVE